MNLSEMKADLLLKNSLRNAGEGRMQESAKNIAIALEKIPVKKIYEQALYIENELLPQIEKKSGVTHKSYIFYKELFTTLLWAIVVLDRNDMLETRFFNSEMQRTYFQDYAASLERLLSKYIALEDLFLSSGLDVVAKGVVDRAKDVLNKIV